MMSRYYLLLASIGLIIAASFALKSSRASDDDKPPVSVLPKDEISEVAELLDRIEQLEKRLASLEDRGPLVRQADSKEALKSAAVVPSPLETHDDEDEDPIQNTNGQRWTFKLLNYRPTVVNPVRTPKLDRSRIKQPTNAVFRGI